MTFAGWCRLPSVGERHVQRPCGRNELGASEQQTEGQCGWSWRSRGTAGGRSLERSAGSRSVDLEGPRADCGFVWDVDSEGWPAVGGRCDCL